MASLTTTNNKLCNASISHLYMNTIENLNVHNFIYLNLVHKVTLIDSGYYLVDDAGDSDMSRESRLISRLIGLKFSLQLFKKAINNNKRSLLHRTHSDNYQFFLLNLDNEKNYGYGFEHIKR